MPNEIADFQLMSVAIRGDNFGGSAWSFESAFDDSDWIRSRLMRQFSPMAGFALRAVPVMSPRAVRDLLDVVQQAVQTPLRADLGQAPEREPAHALVVPDVVKHRLDGCNALAVQPPAAR